MKPTAGRSLTGAGGGVAVQSGWRVGRPGRRRSLPETLEHPGWQLRPGAGMCSARRGGGEGDFSLQFRVGSLGAPRPGCAGAPSQFESGGGAEWVQPSPGADIVVRCPPSRAAPHRAQLPSGRSRRRRRRPPAGPAAAAAAAASSARPPLPPRRLRAQIPPAPPASRAPGLRSFLSLLFSPSHRHLLASTAAICKAPLTLALRGAGR